MSFYAKHEVTGCIAEYPDHYRNHPVFSAVLTEVAKPTGCSDCGLPPVEEETEVIDQPDVVEQTPDVPAAQQWTWPSTDTYNTEKD